MDESRRGFLKLAFAGVNAALAALVSVPVVGYLLDPLFKKRKTQLVDAGTLDSLKGSEPKRVKLSYITQSGPTQVRTDQNVWVTVEGEAVTVFSSKCTHLNCNVVWRSEEQHFNCPCHGGIFDRDGNVTAGPPPRPLDRLPCTVRDGKVFVEVS